MSAAAGPGTEMLAMLESLCRDRLELRPSREKPGETNEGYGDRKKHRQSGDLEHRTAFGPRATQRQREGERTLDHESGEQRRRAGAEADILR